MKKVGFIGLGCLGSAIARRLISEGIELVVWNRTGQKATDLGMEIAGSPLDLARRVDVIFLSLFDSTAVRDVLSGRKGMLEADSTHYLSSH